jgi:hypothetical protein
MKKNSSWQYSQLSIEVTAKLSKNEKKEFGIFITPRIIIEQMIDLIQTYIKDQNITICDILEPACGTCEIVNCCDQKFSDVNIDAVEINPNMFKSLDHMLFQNKVTLFNQDFILYNPTKNYDLVFTNPPYFVCKKQNVPKKYQEFIWGRPNIFGLFIIHSIFMTKLGGLLAFIIPKSFLNSAYYSKIRNYIKKKCKIVKIIDFEKDSHFIDTQQATFGIILHKYLVENESPTRCDYSLKINDNFIFTNEATILQNIFEGATTIEKMGLKVRTGQVVWNQHKANLTDNSDNSILLYNTNVTSTNKIVLKVFDNKDKFQYINLPGRHDPILIVNRGNGNSKYKLNYALIEKGPYLVENHMNEIYSEIERPDEVLIEMYKKIMTSFKNPKTKQFIDLFLGNNSLSKTELETVLPIYL